MLPLIGRLFEALESEGVAYCHWKSNAFLAAAADGEDDLDLLVGPSGRQAFLGVLLRLGFKEAWVPSRADRIPGILDYYGYDNAAFKLVHVHAHYKLVLGQDMTKNYHLPIESAYLDSSFRGEWARVPAPEFEWCVFAIRMVLKHSTWNTILGGLGNLSGRERQEMEFLRRSISPERTSEALSRLLPFVDPLLFDECVRALEPGSSFRARVKAGHGIQKALRGCRILPGAVDVWLQFWRRLVQAGRRRRLWGRRPGKRMTNGGLLVAVAGGDGSGKTTLIEGISKWLCPPLAGAKIHMGKPPWSPTTTLVRGVLKAGRSLRLYPFERAPLDPHTAADPAVFPGYPSLLREVCTARDRYRSYVRARKQADQGVFVLCDRFPLPGLILTDGPLVGRVATDFPGKRFVRLLARLEARYYRSILPPDLLLMLKVDPETAVARKTDERAESVRARSQEIWNRDWDGPAVQVIDASRSKDEVLERAKSLVWARL
jgi:thymidylate kinase